MESQNSKVLENQEERFIIGRGNIDDMQKAVEREFHTGIRPLVETDKEMKKGNWGGEMEGYAKLLVKYIMEQSGFNGMKINFDGCAADLIFSHSSSNLCMGIQVKTCSRFNEETHSYDFGASSPEYDGMLLYFRCLENGIAFLIPYLVYKENYTDKRSINITIGRTRIDWETYKVSDDDLSK